METNDMVRQPTQEYRHGGRKRANRDSGLSLVELMVALAILGVLAGIAAPSFSRDNSEADFRNYVNQLARDMRKARIEALSSREDRSIFLHPGPPHSYTLEAAIPNQTTTALINKPQVAPEGVQIAGAITVAAEPGSGITDAAVLPAEIRFTGTNQVFRLTGSNVGTIPPTPGSATIFLQSADGRKRARIVVFGATAHANTYFNQ